MPRVTLKTIAAECGVSISTASLALSGKGKISPQQVERIQAKAKEMGYIPNPLLASLASKRFRTGEAAMGNLVAVLEFPYDTSRREARSNLYTQDLRHWAFEFGYNPEFFNVADMQSYKDLPAALYRRGTLGVIVSGQPDHTLFADREKWASFSMVQCGRYKMPLPLHTVRPDIFRAVKTAFLELKALGYRRIGFAFGMHQPPIEDDEARYGAALAMEFMYSAPADRVPIWEGVIGDVDRFGQWALRHRPEAVIGFHQGQWYALRDAGLRVPEDIGFAYMHVNLPVAKSEPSIAGMDQGRPEIARQSVVLLDQLIRHNSRGFPRRPRSVLIESTWMPGPSVCQQPERPAPSKATRRLPQVAR